MKSTETFTEQSQPPGPSFPSGFTPRVIRRYALPCKTLSSGPKVARFCEGVKKVRQGVRATLSHPVELGHHIIIKNQSLHLQ